MKKILFSSFFCLIAASLIAQVTFTLSTIPENTPENATIYIVGTFNDWDPGHSDYILEENDDGSYQITIDPEAGELKYKFTRGDWETVEGNESGQYRPDRIFNYDGTESTLDHSVLSWEDLGGNSGNTTATDNVLIVSEDFFMPQLNRNRKVLIYLPPDYEETDNHYPVLYMHDGQNVFDAFTSFSGEWEVDESLNQLFADGDEGIIVVAIDNGGTSRTDEYSPWVNSQYGGGEGDEYMAFIVETLKPHIDENYRTRPERDHTGIMGSSLGGLISNYAAVEYQEVFSKAGIFSPAYWFADEVFTHVTNTGKQADMRIYFLAGEQETSDPDFLNDFFAMYNTFLSAGFSEDELFILTHQDGQHSEWYWRREFPDAYEWLFANSETTEVGQAFLPQTMIQILPNPADSVIKIETTLSLDDLSMNIYHINGKIIQAEKALTSNEVDISNLPPGTYVVSFFTEGKSIGSKKIVVH